MSWHKVVVYANPGARTFTATARKVEARLAEVDAWAAAAGYSLRIEHAKRIPSQQSGLLKAFLMKAYRGQGYKYCTRPALS